MKRSPMPRRSQPIARGTRPKRKKQPTAEFRRVYGSSQRITFVSHLPCAVPGCESGPCQNAHTENGGMGRKADARTIIPLCQWHHAEQHAIGAESFQSRYGVDFAAMAAAVAARWDATQEEA